MNVNDIIQWYVENYLLLHEEFHGPFPYQRFPKNTSV